MPANATPPAATLAAPAGESWLDRALQARDRLLMSPRFQRFAAATPGLRWVARRRARATFDLCAGFVYTQVLLAATRLGVFAILAEGPAATAPLALRLGLPEAATLRLLEAMCALQLAEPRRGGRFGLGSLGTAVAGNPGILALIEHHALLYQDLADPVRLLRSGSASGLGDYWAYARSGNPAALPEAAIRPYTELMAASQTLVAGEVLDSYNFARHRCLLDVGGGNGTFLIAAARRHPHLQLLLFDLPAVAACAATHLAGAGLAARSSCTGGDFCRDPLPPGADLITLVRVLHDHDDASVQRILAAAYRALPARGVLVIAEPMADTPGAEPMGAAYFGFYLLAMGQGRPRSAQALAALVQGAGFCDARLVPTQVPLQARVLIAVRP